jgi:hypothetical protein
VIDSTLLLAAAGALGVIATALATYLVARRTSSGQIGTSSADTLWRAAEALRVELVAEVLRQRGRIDQLEAKLDSQEREIARLNGRLARYENGDRT